MTTSCPTKLQQQVNYFIGNPVAIEKLSEYDIRDSYISVLFKALGWNWDNEGLSPTELEVLREFKVKAGRPDLKFCIYGQPKFYVETKKWRVEFTFREIHQAWSYGYSSGHSFSILSNFNQLLVIDCRNTPIGNISDGRIKDQVVIQWNCTDYVNYWSKIFSLLSKTSVLNGSFEELEKELSSKTKKVFGPDKLLIPLPGVKPVDQLFLSQLDGWRARLAKNVHQQEKKLPPSAVTELADSLLNFIVFTRVIESRNFAPKGISLREAIEKAKKKGVSLFREINYLRDNLEGIFNGTVYKAFPGTLNIDDEILADIIRNTYPPHSPYDLSYVPIEMLGTIYEQFLGHRLAFEKSDIKISEKKEAQKKGGIFYTESYITSFMVRELLDNRIKDLTPEEILELRIADISCGSGSFLIMVLRFLIAWMEAICKKTDDLREKYLYRDKDGQWKLSIDTKLDLLRNCIYGVDIDPEAVSVTKLSLYLQVLEGETASTIQSFYKRKKKPILPILDRNIKCGNSIVDFDIVKQNLFDNQVLSDINPINFQEAFPEVFNKGGFDLLFGNPPYSAELSDIVKEYCKRYSLASRNLNTANLFIDRTRQLVKPDGGWCLIVPKSLIYSDKWVLTRNELRKELILAVDASKAFKDVRLEQVIIGASKKDSGCMKTGFITKTKRDLFKGKKDLSFSDILPVNLTDKEIELGQIIVNNSDPMISYFWLERGVVPASTLRMTGKEKVYRGRNVQGYCLIESKEGISEKEAKAIYHEHKDFKGPKLMAQQIVAHSLKPTPHVRFVATIDLAGSLSIDTVSNIFSRETIKKPQNLLWLLLGIFNSRIFSWYGDRFIYAKAIRTMHLDNYHISKMRFPKKDSWKTPTTEMIIKLTKKRVSLLPKKSANGEQSVFQSAAKAYEIQINDLVGKLFGLSEIQIRGIDKFFGDEYLSEMGQFARNLGILRERVVRKKNNNIETTQMEMFNHMK